MNFRTTTMAVCVIVPVLLVLYDAVCATTPAEDSITAIVRGWNRYSDGLVALGLLAIWIHCFACPTAWRWK